MIFPGVREKSSPESTRLHISLKSHRQSYLSAPKLPYGQKRCICILVYASDRSVCRGRKRSTIPDHGQDCRQGHPEVPAIYLRAIVAGESRERQSPKTADGTGSSGCVEIRSADALGFYQQGSC